ncbi:MAG: CoA-binding protein [Thermoplasmata archaeon]
MDNTGSKTEMLRMKRWAVVGASPDRSRYSYRIFNLLCEQGYEVYAVNPNYDKIDGKRCYSGLGELPAIPDVVCMVVNPKIGKKIVEETLRLGIKHIWFQPGSYDDEIIEFAGKNGISYVKGCVLLELGNG